MAMSKNAPEGTRGVLHRPIEPAETSRRSLQDRYQKRSMILTLQLPVSRWPMASSTG
jgi:hypothetical protein